VILVDGMSSAAATDLIQSITDVNDASESAPERATALALLPSLTKHSRTSVFTGDSRTGGQSQERKGIGDLARTAGLRGAAIFHKDDFVRRESGNALAARISGALADVESNPFVACVLNSIDDALDKSDPAGTRWSTETIQYLQPLLQEAALAGRTVLITADHGHIVEQNGRLERFEGTTSARSRTTDGGPAEVGEILVEGRRVLDGSAILAVDDDLRYTERKAGYHGGASLAELVVPVIVLRPRPVRGTEDAWNDELPQGWTFISDQRPLWWSARTSDAAPAPAADHVVTPVPGMLDLFGSSEPDAEPIAPVGLGEAIIGSNRFAEQKRVLRRTPADSAVAALVDELATAPSTRLPFSRVSQLLSTPAARTRRTASVVAQLLNVEGFEVLRIEEETVILDVDLACQQFEVSRS
jgi:hypothetical protein